MKVHFGVDMAGRDSQHRMKELLSDMEVDVVGLLESDRMFVLLSLLMQCIEWSMGIAT